MKNAVTAAVIALAVAGLAAADQGRTEIGPTTTFPIVINTPGSYVLTADLHVTAVGIRGFQIEADDVTLDLGGHVIQGPGEGSAFGTGIYGHNRRNVTITNGTVTEFAYGVFLSGSSSLGNRFGDLSVSHCGVSGLHFDNGSVRDVVVHNNARAGLTGSGLICSYCSVSNVTAKENFIGINVQNGSVQNSTSSYNLDDGFRLNSSSMTGGSATHNGGDGVSALGGCTLIGVSVTINDGWGIELLANGSNNVVNCGGAFNALGGIFGCASGNGCMQNYVQ
jgi:hypothetical protein